MNHFILTPYTHPVTFTFFYLTLRWFDAAITNKRNISKIIFGVQMKRSSILWCVAPQWQLKNMYRFCGIFFQITFFNNISLGWWKIDHQLRINQLPSRGLFKVFVYLTLVKLKRLDANFLKRMKKWAMSFQSQ